MAQAVLVTGGAGYIGSHTCKALAEDGFFPVAYDNLQSGHAEAVRWGPLVHGDVRDATKLTAAMRTHRVSHVLHFAACANVGESVRQPLDYYHNNVAGSLSLLAAMHLADVPALVFSSTCAVYGMPQRLPLTEDHPQAPVSPYGASKMMVERVLADAAAAGGPRSVSLRYFNAAGADADGHIGERHAPETHLIPLALAATCGATLTLHGDDYPTDDGTPVRDYIHVTDLADAHVRAVRLLERGAIGAQAFNLGTGSGFSVRQVLATVAEVCGAAPRVSVGPRRPGDPPVLVADSGAAQRELGWQPRHRDLHEMVASAWRWQQRLAVQLPG